MNAQNGYVVIIGDMVNSRKLTDRAEVQQRFKEVLSAVNCRYGEDIAAGFDITLGDEFQGLLRSGRFVLPVIGDIQAAMQPVQFRFGIGVGSISTEVNRARTAEIDGEAYHRARDMMMRLKDRKHRYAKWQTDVMLCGMGESDAFINTVLSLCSALRSKWTGRQHEIIDAYAACGGNQYKTAAALNIAQSTVNRALHGARFYAYQSGMQTVQAALAGEEDRDG